MTPSHPFFRTLALLVASVALPACVSSQSQRGPGDARRGDRVDRQVESMREAVGLSDAQANQVRAIFGSASDRPERGARRGAGRPAGDREATRARRAERRAEIERQIEAVLTEAQAKRYRAWRDAQQDQRRGRRGDG